MPYDEKLAARIRESLAHLPHVEEKKMFRGVTFMVNDKMCVGVSGNDLMCRFDPAIQETAEQKKGFRKVIMGKRELKGYGYISQDALRSKTEFDYWIGIALEFNKVAKSSKKKR